MFFTLSGGGGEVDKRAIGSGGRRDGRPDGDTEVEFGVVLASLGGGVGNDSKVPPLSEDGLEGVVRMEEFELCGSTDVDVFVVVVVTDESLNVRTVGELSSIKAR